MSMGHEVGTGGQDTARGTFLVQGAEDAKVLEHSVVCSSGSVFIDYGVCKKR